MTRWSLSVSDNLDFSLRRFLAGQGIKKGDLSKFVEEAVRWRMLDKIVSEVKEKNKDVSGAEIDAAIEEALADVRAND